MRGRVFACRERIVWVTHAPLVLVATIINATWSPAVTRSKPGINGVKGAGRVGPNQRCVTASNICFYVQARLGRISSIAV